MTEHKPIVAAGPDRAYEYCAAGCQGEWPCAQAPDLTGHQNDGWTVVAKAPAQNRKRYWTAKHSCGASTDVAQAQLREGAMPACQACTSSVPAEGGTDALGKHLPCGQIHAFGECPLELLADGTTAQDHVGHGCSVDPAPPSEVTAVRAINNAHATEILNAIRTAMLDNPRSLQEELGPSELGGCERRLGHRIAFGKAPELDVDSLWRPAVGTAVHKWLDTIFSAAEGFLSAQRVLSPVEGELDLFYIAPGIVVDFKVTGKTTRDRALRRDVDDTYETQLDLYGAGLVAAGHDVTTVALLFLPASGSLKDAVWYARPFNPKRAQEAVERYARVDTAVEFARRFDVDMGKVLATLETTEDHCSYCPALGTHCEGAKGANLWGAPVGMADPPWPAWDAALAEHEREAS